MLNSTKQRLKFRWEHDVSDWPHNRGAVGKERGPQLKEPLGKDRPTDASPKGHRGSDLLAKFQKTGPCQMYSHPEGGRRDQPASLGSDQRLQGCLWNQIRMLCRKSNKKTWMGKRRTGLKLSEPHRTRAWPPRCGGCTGSGRRLGCGQWAWGTPRAPQGPSAQQHKKEFIFKTEEASQDERLETGMQTGELPQANCLSNPIWGKKNPVGRPRTGQSTDTYLLRETGRGSRGSQSLEGRPQPPKGSQNPRGHPPWRPSFQKAWQK